MVLCVGLTTSPTPLTSLGGSGQKPQQMSRIHTPLTGPSCSTTWDRAEIHVCKKKRTRAVEGYSVTEGTRKGCILLEGLPALEDSSPAVLLPRGRLVTHPPAVLLPRGRLVTGPHPSSFGRELAGAHPPPTGGCLSLSQPPFPYS